MEIHNEQRKCDPFCRLFIVYLYCDLALMVPIKKEKKRTRTDLSPVPAFMTA